MDVQMIEYTFDGSVLFDAVDSKGTPMQHVQIPRVGDRIVYCAWSFRVINVTWYCEERRIVVFLGDKLKVCAS